MNLQNRLETRTHFNRFEPQYLLYVAPILNNANAVKCPQNI